MKRRAAAVVSLLAVCLGAPALAAPATLVAEARLSPVALDLIPAVDAERFVLTVSTPRGDVVRREFAAGSAITFSIADSRGQYPDGDYRWELTAAPRLRPADRAALDRARAKDDPAALAEAQRLAGIPEGGFVQSGSFRVAGGAIVDSAREESRGPVRAALPDLKNAPAADQVIPDDLIVQGSECVGLDCVNNETFDFDTLRLKENNTRLQFNDTSTSAGFSTNNWQIRANASPSGGASFLGFVDQGSTGASESGNIVLSVAAGAASNSIFVDSSSRLGLRTSVPVLDLHINTGNTPAIRLEQNNSSGFTAQTWDIAGNEANFFIRDVTGGSKLPFRIRPGAPTSSVDISADGDVGIGTASPGTKLHVSGSNGATKVLIQESSGTASPREMLELRNNGGAILILEDTSVAPRWSFGTSGNGFVIDNQAHAGVEMSLDQNGNVVFLGTVTPPSSREVKRDFVMVSPSEVLDKVLALPITTWSYNHDATVRHIGPMAEDFFDAFAVGATNKGISTTDSEGVALAAIQGLHLELEQRDREIAELREQLAALAARLDGMAGQP